MESRGVASDSGRHRRSRVRVGLAGALAFIERCVNAGEPVPCAHKLAMQFGWRESSAQDALTNLAAAGHLMVVGRDPRTRRTLYELRSYDASRTKTCCRCGQAKGEAEFWRSRATNDGLSSVCKACTRGAESDRQAQQAAARLARRQRISQRDARNRGAAT